MARLPKLSREQLPDNAIAAWEKAANADGAPRGPHAALIYVPDISEPVSDLGDRLRNHGNLSDADRELAICATVREGEARFAWQAHEARAGAQAYGRRRLRRCGPRAPATH